MELFSPPLEACYRRAFLFGNLYSESKFDRSASSLCWILEAESSWERCRLALCQLVPVIKVWVQGRFYEA